VKLSGCCCAGSYAAGGGVASVGFSSSFFVEDAVFRGNSAAADWPDFGGVVEIHDGSLFAAYITLFVENTALYGGVAYFDSESTFTTTNSTFQANSAAGQPHLIL